MPAALGVAATAVTAWTLWQARGEPAAPAFEVVAADAGPVHVHGLGINPADGALFIATHTGTWRVAPGAMHADRVGDNYQDTMGFTVAGPNHFLGSGHPDIEDARERGLPAQLGLIESRDAGRTWRSVSLLGEADFHTLRYVRPRVYGYDVSKDRLLVSADGGRSWRLLARPAGVVDLAVAPNAPRRLVAATERGMFASESGGREWRRVGDAFGYLAWPATRSLFLVAADGTVLTSADGGATWTTRGGIGGEPAALLAQTSTELYAALHDGTIKRSLDGGRTWTVRARP